MSAIVEGRRGLVGGDVGFCGGAWNVDRMEGRGDVGGAPAVVEVELRSEDLGERGVGVMCGMTANHEWRVAISYSRCLGCCFGLLLSGLVD